MATTPRCAFPRVLPVVADEVGLRVGNLIGEPPQPLHGVEEEHGVPGLRIGRYLEENAAVRGLVHPVGRDGGSRAPPRCDD
jgi:hypothetical protein